MNSEGNVQLWQAPQQDARPVQTLRYARTERIGRGRNGMLIYHEGRRSLHVQKHTCANCGYPSASVRKCTSHTTLLEPTDT